MRKGLLLFVVVSLVISGCSHVEVTTVKKDRVDQELKGNEGYLEGGVPQGTREERSKQRTIINFDINLTDDYLGADKKTETDQPEQNVSSKSTSSQNTQYESSQPVAVKPVPAEPVYEEKAEQVVKTVVVEASEVEAEENWIK